LYLEINNFEYRLVEVFQRKLQVNIAGINVILPIFSPQEKQFTIILELLGDNRLNTLTADERRSLAFLKKNERRSSFSPGRSLLDETSVVLSPSDVSVDPIDVDEEGGNGKKWKRVSTFKLLS